MPTTLTGLLLFVTLLLPGITYTAIRERDTPRRARSPFRETVETATASITAGLAALALFAIVRAAFPAYTPDVGALIRDGSSYATLHYAAIATWAAGLLALAAVGAGAAGSLLRRRPLHPSRMSSWWEMFEGWYPGSRVHVGCLLDDGSWVEGELVSYNDSADEGPDRDLILKNPIKHRLPTEASSQPYPAGAVCVAARHIVTMFVTHPPTQEATSASSAALGPAAAESPASPADRSPVAGHAPHALATAEPAAPEQQAARQPDAYPWPRRSPWLVGHAPGPLRAAAGALVGAAGILRRDSRRDGNRRGAAEVYDQTGAVVSRSWEFHAHGPATPPDGRLPAANSTGAGKGAGKGAADG